MHRRFLVNVLLLLSSCLLLSIGFFRIEASAANDRAVRKTFKLEGDWSGSVLGSSFQLFSHSDRTISTEKALQHMRAGEALPSQQERPNFGASPAVHFALFTLENPGSGSERVVLENLFGIIDHFVLYAIKNGELVELMHVGDQASFSSRSYHERTINYELLVEPGIHEYLIRTWGDTCVQLPIKVWKPIDYIHKSGSDLLYIGLLLGFHFVMIFYNLVLYAWIRHRAYLYYVFFVLFNVILHTSNLNLGQYLGYSFFNFEVYSNNIQLSTINCIIISGLLFSRSIHQLDYQIKYSWINRAFTTTVALALVDGFVIQWVSHRLSSILVLIGAMSCLTLMFVINIMAIRAGSKSARFYLAGWIFYLIGSYDVVLIFLGLVEPRDWSNWEQLFGGAIEVALFSLALGNRYMEVQESLFKSESQRAETQRSLRQELQTKFHLMSNLSHRINNPLNHMSTHLAALEKETLRHQKEIIQLLRASMDPDSLEDRQILKTFENRLRTITDTIDEIGQALYKTSQTVQEVRILSGIDGYNWKMCKIDELFAQSCHRIKEVLGESPLFLASPGHIPTEDGIVGNDIALQQALVTILSDMIKRGAIQGPIQYQLNRRGVAEQTLNLQLTKSQIERVQEQLSSSLDVARHLLGPYAIQVHFEETDREITLTFVLQTVVVDQAV